MKKLLSQLILGMGLMAFFTHTATAQWVQTNGPYFALSGGNIFAGTSNAGVWRRPLSEMMEVIDQKNQQGKINQIHFKIDPLSHGSIVAIEFSIPHSDQAAVKIYDLAGKEMSSLVNKYLTAGPYRYFWDAHLFARGCYMVRLQAGAITCTKTVQILH